MVIPCTTKGSTKSPKFGRCIGILGGGLSHYLQGFTYIPKVVGLGISEASTVGGGFQISFIFNPITG